MKDLCWENAYHHTMLFVHSDRCSNSPGTTWNHLQGSGKSLTHFVPCVFEGLSHAVASLPENTVFCISLKCSSSKLFTGGIVLYADGDFSYSQTSQQYRWTRLLWHDYHKQGKQGLEGN